MYANAAVRNGALNAVEGFRKPVGYQQITSVSSVVTLTIPPNVNTQIALIQVESQDVRWRDDGTAPTASVGMLLPKGGIVEYNGDLSKLKFIEVSASAKINVSYYS